MRVLVYTLLKNDETLMGMLPGGLLGDRREGVPDLTPFAVLTHEGPTPGMGKHLAHRVSIWVHDESQDYTEIDKILAYVRELLPSFAPILVNGVWLTSAQWLGDSADLHDTDRGTNTKNAAFLLTGSGL